MMRTKAVGDSRERCFEKSRLPRAAVRVGAVHYNAMAETDAFLEALEGALAGRSVQIQ